MEAALSLPMWWKRANHQYQLQCTASHVAVLGFDARALTQCRSRKPLSSFASAVHVHVS
jgi:hypothetical protein